METLAHIISLAVLAAVLAVVMKKSAPEFALLLTLLAVGLIFTMLAGGIRSFFALLQELGTASGIPEHLLSPLFKTAAIALAVRISGCLCRDAGEQALEAALESAGTICAFVVALPLIREVMDMLVGLL